MMYHIFISFKTFVIIDNNGYSTDVIPSIFHLLGNVDIYTKFMCPKFRFKSQNIVSWDTHKKIGNGTMLFTLTIFTASLNISS